MVLVDRVAVSNDRSLDIYVVGKWLATRIIEEPPWDSAGARMRA